jgi:hypothetical protein
MIAVKINFILLFIFLNFMSEHPQVILTFHIYINGQDVSVQACNETSKNDEASIKHSSEMRECGFEQQYHGGGKKPPYGFPPGFFASPTLDDGFGTGDETP